MSAAPTAGWLSQPPGGARLAATVGSAALYAAAFPPLGWWPLAWVALAPLLWACQGVGPARGAALGACFGALAGYGVAPWLPGTVATFFDASPWVAGGAAALVWLLLGGAFTALFGAWVALASRRRLPSPALVALAWGACELARAHGPVENPWALLAYSQANFLPFAQIADLIGPFGVGAILAAANAALLSIVLEGGRRRWLPAGAMVALTGLACLYGVLRLEQSFDSGPSQRVAVVQGAVPPAQRFQAEHRNEHLSRYLALTERAREAGASFAAWPEFAVEFVPARDPDGYRALRRASNQIELLFGALGERETLLVREPVNAAFLLRGGREIARYDKVRLMPFSEMRPRWSPVGSNRFRPGLALTPLPAQAGALGVLICSEGMHPGHAQALVASGAELLVNPANDDWFGSRAAARQQTAAAVFRAIETRRPLLRPSTSGQSVIVDAHGRVLARVPYGEPGIAVAEVVAANTASPYHLLTQRLPSSAQPWQWLAFAPLVWWTRPSKRS